MRLKGAFVMEKNVDFDLIKKIISEGNISLETISAELNIPMASLVLMKRKSNNETSKKKVTKIQMECENRYKKIYEKYVSAYYGKNNKKDSQEPELTENEKVAIATDEIERIVKSKEIDSEKKVFSVLPIIRRLQDEKFSLNQAHTLLKIYLDRSKLPFPEHDRYADFRHIDMTYKKMLVKKLMEAVRYECDITESIEQLNSLKRYITPEITKIEPMSVKIVNDKISSKITKINTDNAMKDYENNISNNVSNIVCSIASEIIDIDLIEDSIKKETDERMAIQKVKNKFSLTEDQHRKQIYYKVTRALETYADIYPIFDAEKSIGALEKIFGMGFTSNFKCVIQNIIERKEYAEAKLLCEKYLMKTESFSANAKAIDRARTEIAKAEFGEIIVKGLEAKCSEAEHEAFIESVDNKISRLGYMKSTIPLGRCEDKTKKIMLSDIWVDKQISPKR